MIRQFLAPLLGVFSRRHVGRRFPPDELPATLRNRIFLLLRDVFAGRWRQFSTGEDYAPRFWGEIHSALLHAYGRLRLSSDPRVATPADDVLAFLPTCPPEEFLDFVELTFRAQCLFHVLHDENQLVDALNDLFRAESAPYQVTPFVKQVEDDAVVRLHPFDGGRVVQVVAYPKVIRVEEDLTYVEALSPALSVLADPAFSVASAELRAALDDYRKGDFGDCLTKCGSAFESVMKVICAKRGWPYDPMKDTAPSLLKTILPRTDLGTFFEQPLMLVATMRNRLSTAHGGGTVPRNVERHIAQYAITSTAAAILLLVHETEV